MSSKFDTLVYDWLKPSNKYMIGALFATFIMYTISPNIRYSLFVDSLLSNKLVQLFIVFCALVVLQRIDPTTALYISIAIVVLFYLLGKLLREGMAEIKSDAIPEEKVPAYSYTDCDETPIGYFEGEAESPITNVSEAEMQSLCQHLNKDKFECNDIKVLPQEFSELVDPKKACSFAKHQLINKNPNVKCAKKVKGDGEVFSTLAPVN